MRSAFRLSMVVLLAMGCGDGGEEPRDAGSVDAAFDAAQPDGGQAPEPDASVQDAAIPDAAIPDAAIPDGGAIDAGADGGAIDAGADGGGLDAGDETDAGTESDAGSDAGIDADAGTDAGVTRTGLLPTFCPSVATPAGFYRGTLEYGTNDHSFACGLSAPGGDGFVRVEVAPGQTLRAVYRHAGDGVLYLLDNCPVLLSCLDQSDVSRSGPEEVEWTNTASTTNPVYLGLDSAAFGPPDTFELDIYLTP